MRDVDGRQTRPANDVGRPNGRAVSASVYGRREARDALRAAFWAGAEAARAGRDNGANADAQVSEIIALWEEAVREGLGRR